jgi:hypothetical protein
MRPAIASPVRPNISDSSSECQDERTALTVIDKKTQFEHISAQQDIDAGREKFHLDDRDVDAQYLDRRLGEGEADIVEVGVLRSAASRGTTDRRDAGRDEAKAPGDCGRYAGDARPGIDQCLRLPRRGETHSGRLEGVHARGAQRDEDIDKGTIRPDREGQEWHVGVPRVT